MARDQLPRCGAFRLDDGSVCWRVWAPNARSADLVLIDGDRRQARRMTAEPHGYFSHAEPNIDEGQRYAYRLNGGPERPDPQSLWQPDGVHRPSAVLFPERFPWAEQGWRGIRREDLVLYELHVGTFTAEGTFDAVIPRLDALRELGVTAVELMPLAQFPGDRNWGYDGVHFHAPQNTYGGPHGLQRLVNACHAKGLAVFLDVVYNHCGPEGNYLHEFGPYFTDRYRTAWGPAFNYDGSGSDPVREFILDNVRVWIGDYRMDGLRLDAIHSIHDCRPTHLLREIKTVADAAAARLGRPAYVTAESNFNDVRILETPEHGGHGLDGQWNDDFHHAVHALLTGERNGYYVDFGLPRQLRQVLERTFYLDGIYSAYRGRRQGAPARGFPGDRFIGSIQNHDQVGNRARSDRLSTILNPPAVRLAASLMLLAPHLPLLFMGEEYGEENPFLFFCSFLDRGLVENVRKGRQREYSAFIGPGQMRDPQDPETFAASRLSWSWPEGTPRAGLRRLYGDLLNARQRWPALKDFTKCAARLLPHEEGGVLELVRGRPDEQPDRALWVYFNLTDQVQSLPQTQGRRQPWVFSSEWQRYGGTRSMDEFPDQLRPYECVAFGATKPATTVV